MLTVLDGHPHTLAFLATINRMGEHEPGSHRAIDTDGIVAGALDLLG